MSDYTPDRWTVIRIHTTGEVIYKVFASWSGGGLMGSDSWKLNSGIVRATLADSYWEFDGSSGSVYRCHQDSYGTNGYGGAVLSNLISNADAQGIQVEVMERDTDWTQLEYDPLAQWVESGVRDV
jgi:expansin (peptidoglycan-binding protein)